MKHGFGKVMDWEQEEHVKTSRWWWKETEWFFRNSSNLLTILKLLLPFTESWNIPLPGFRVSSIALSASPLLALVTCVLEYLLLLCFFFSLQCFLRQTLGSKKKSCLCPKTYKQHTASCTSVIFSPRLKPQNIWLSALTACVKQVFICLKIK